MMRFWHWLLITGLLLATLLTGCSLDDDRDDCSIKQHFRYYISGEDRLTHDVLSMRHFLFDADSIYLREVSDPCHCSDPVLKIDDLNYGTYTLITLGNLTGLTRLSELRPGVTHLTAFQQHLDSQWATRADGDAADGGYANGDDLFYNATTFSVTDDAPDTYICDMSNIHCHLHVLVYWEQPPSYSGRFTVQLTGVPSGYSLHPDSTRRILQQDDMAELTVPTAKNRVQLFPVEPLGLVSHVQQVRSYNYELEAHFTTQRYTADCIPVLQVFCNGEAVTGRIDLARAFAYLRWYPDQSVEQDYSVKMRINPDGSVDLNRWMQGRVSDWIDGGSIGN